MQQLIRADSWLPLLPWCIQPVFRLNCVSVSSACQEEAEPGGRLGNTVLAGVPFGLSPDLSYFSHAAFLQGEFMEIYI